MNEGLPKPAKRAERKDMRNTILAVGAVVAAAGMAKEASAQQPGGHRDAEDGRTWYTAEELAAQEKAGQLAERARDSDPEPHSVPVTQKPIQPTWQSGSVNITVNNSYSRGGENNFGIQDDGTPGIRGAIDNSAAAAAHIREQAARNLRRDGSSVFRHGRPKPHK